VVVLVREVELLGAAGLPGLRGDVELALVVVIEGDDTTAEQVEGLGLETGVGGISPSAL
jgi:hypothetical protein